jgi:hypothetical protein
MKTFFSTCYLVIYSLVCVAQSDTTEIKENIYNRVYKNVAAFYINYAVKSKMELNQGYLFDNMNNYFFDSCLPDKGFKLDMKITKLDWKYPVDGYSVYEIKLNGLSFVNELSGKIKTTLQIDGSLKHSLSRYYLLCINGEKIIKFISGSYFLNNISNDFKLDINNLKSYIDYLKFRNFEDQIDEIIYFKKKRGKLLFKGYSKEFQKNVILYVDIENPNLIDLSLKDETHITRE